MTDYIILSGLIYCFDNVEKLIVLRRETIFLFIFPLSFLYFLKNINARKSCTNPSVFFSIIAINMTALNPTVTNFSIKYTLTLNILYIYMSDEGQH